MNRRRSALVWGLVGSLSFLVGHQAYLLVGGRFLGFLPILAVAIGVGIAAGVASYYFEGILAARVEAE